MQPDAKSTRFPNRPIRPLPQRRQPTRQSQLRSSSALVIDPELSKYRPDSDKIHLPSLEIYPCSPTEGFLIDQRSAFDTGHGRQPYNDLDCVLGSLNISEHTSGYDALENANNKKKRKIPSLMDVPQEQSALYQLPQQTKQELIDNGLNTPQPTLNHQSAITNRQSLNRENVRGRQGRRKPLRARSDTSNTLSKLKIERDAGAHNSKMLSSTNICSLDGQENASSTDTDVLNSPSFTFTCNSLNHDTLLWPEKSPSSMQSSTTNSIASPNTLDAGIDERPIRPRSRRPLSEVLHAAADYRRRIAAAKQARSPPKQEDVWICEFCDYESIFGTPPRALVRIYELKDRKLRKDEQERQRLLQKAKSKSWKNRKNNIARVTTQKTAQSDLAVLESGTEGVVIANSQGNPGSITEYALDETPPRLGPLSAGNHIIPSGT